MNCPFVLAGDQRTPICPCGSALRGTLFLTPPGLACDHPHAHYVIRCANALCPRQIDATCKPS